jgi:hypothetical protein
MPNYQFDIQPINKKANLTLYSIMVIGMENSSYSIKCVGVNSQAEQFR